MADRLPSELLCFIGLKLDSAADRIRFRAVSKSWRSALPFRRPPMLMLAKTPNEIQFVNVGEETVFRIHFPDRQLHGEDYVLGSTSNWPILVEAIETTILCLNIFSPTQFQLPSSLKVLPCGVTTKLVLSPPHVVALGIFWNASRFLAIARHGDEFWDPVAGYPNMRLLFLEDCVFYQQRIYAVSNRGEIVACDIGYDSNPPRLSFLLECSVEKEMFPMQTHYLVEVSGELLMVVRFLDANRRTKQFKLYKLDLGKLSFEELKCLGDHSLFLGLNTSVSVLAPAYFGLVRRNCIYFADDLVCRNCMTRGFYHSIPTNRDIGVFDLEVNSVTPHFRSAVRSTIWVIPQQR